MSPSYNKGEWSEAYVLIKVLADGTLQQGNGDLEATDEKPYKVISVRRKENDAGEKVYSRGENEIYVSGESSDTIAISKFATGSCLLLEEIKAGKGRSFPLSSELWSILNDLSIQEIKADSNDKTDIRIEIRDHFRGIHSLLGFSIKSQLGSASTLVNASKSTNFRFKVVCPSESSLKEAQTQKNGKDVVRYLKANGAKFELVEALSSTFSDNLRLIDSDLSAILGECLIEYYSGSVSSLSDILANVDYSNPLNYPQDHGVSFYAYKIKKYLTESALGMMPSFTWHGTHDATGGYIIVKNSGELLSYHLLRKNLFEDYLIANTKFETASTSRNDFGYLRKLDDTVYLDLNLQIRFKK